VTALRSRWTPRRAIAAAWGIGALPLIAIVLALGVGAIVILSSELIIGGNFDPFLPITAYKALILGAFGSFDAIVDTLVATSPLVFGGLAVATAFKAGLFNIGAQGQFLMGALGAVVVGVAMSNQPIPIAIAATVAAGILVGGITGFIPGLLKAVSGAHEVVTTIMLNYVAISILAALVSGPLKVPGSPSPVTYDVGNASYPVVFGRNGHIGIVIAVLAVILVRWLLYRTTIGFEIRTVGTNPDAAAYAGMRPRRMIVLTMSLAGALAGLAGTDVVLGVTHQMTSSFGTTVGFDSIAVALLARSEPYGILPAALLFGAMRAGASLMQIQAGIPVELVDVIQATILLVLVATPVLRRLFRLRGARPGIATTPTITRSYGGEVAPPSASG
jgi:general nucleoside transport system permease protein